MDATDADDHTRGRSAAELLIEAVRHPQTELEEGRRRIAQTLDALASSELAFGLLFRLPLGPATHADDVFFGLDLLEQRPPVLDVSLVALVESQLGVEHRHGWRL